MKFSNFASVVNQGITSGNWKLLEDWVNEESSFSFAAPNIDEKFNEDVFQEMLKLLDQESFIRANGSSKVLHIIELDWGTLSHAQKQQLLPVLARNYAKYNDPLSWFLISEILGEYYANEQSFTTLQGLLNTDKEEARALLPMGFEQIIRHTHEKEVKHQALEELEKLHNDASASVREEVETSWRRIANLGNLLE